MPTTAAAQRGFDMLLKYQSSADGVTPLVFTSVAGLRSKSVKINQGLVDVTTHDSNRWREILAAAGTRDVSLSGQFIAKSGAGGASKLVDIQLAGAFIAWQIILPSIYTMQGLFFLQSLDVQSAHDKEVSGTLNLMSTGEVTFTAPT